MSETECTLKFLEACNLMFEKGFLSHDIISVRNKQVLINIEKGYDFLQVAERNMQKKVQAHRIQLVGDVIH